MNRIIDDCFQRKKNYVLEDGQSCCELLSDRTHVEKWVTKPIPDACPLPKAVDTNICEWSLQATGNADDAHFFFVTACEAEMDYDDVLQQKYCPECGGLIKIIDK